MKFKSYPVLVWFLDSDLEKSAQCLTNKLLAKSINGCMQCLLSARFYCIGFRTAKHYKYYFDASRKNNTLNAYFPLWPFKTKPSYQGYNSKEGKWCRSCLEHYSFIENYMDILLDEVVARTGKDHQLAKFLEWNKYDAPKLKLPIANINNIVLPWKVLNPKYRKKDIVEGYRLQYKSFLEKNGFKLEDFSIRDTPDFVVSTYEKWLE